MRIIPAIDIKNGKCVRLFQGNYAKEIVYGDDPVFMAKKWESQGATILHIVDLDGAKEGKMVNMNVIKKIADVVDIPLQVGGGIRNIVSIIRIIDVGAKYAILGTAALEKFNSLKKIIDTYGEKLIISLDVRNGIMMKNGWVKKSNSDVIQTIKKIEAIGIKTIIYTDITRDGALAGPNYGNIELIRKNTGIRLIVAGGISSIDQIIRLKKMDIDGVIIGKALYEGKINLKEAIKLC